MTMRVKDEKTGKDHERNRFDGPLASEHDKAILQSRSDGARHRMSPNSINSQKGKGREIGKQSEDLQLQGVSIGSSRDQIIPHVDPSPHKGKKQTRHAKIELTNRASYDVEAIRSRRASPDSFSNETFHSATSSLSSDISNRSTSETLIFILEQLIERDKRERKSDSKTFAKETNIFLSSLIERTASRNQYVRTSAMAIIASLVPFGGVTAAAINTTLPQDNISQTISTDLALTVACFIGLGAAVMWSSVISQRQTNSRYAFKSANNAAINRYQPFLEKYSTELELDGPFSIAPNNALTAVQAKSSNDLGGVPK